MPREFPDWHPPSPEIVGMDFDVEGGEEGVKMEEKLVFMCGYLPGALPQRTLILSPMVVRLSQGGGSWKDVCGGGCGFAMAISDSGKLITWGSTDDLGQSYVTSGKHGRMAEPFPLPNEAIIVRAAAGWAHCVAATAGGEVYTWGWKECIPSGKVFGDPSTGSIVEKDASDKQSILLTEQVSPRSHGSRSSGGSASGGDSRGADEASKRRRLSPARQAAESSSSVDETFTAFPCLVTLNPGLRITAVAAGGRHTLALSDIGQVWGWGYGGEGQLGVGSRIRMVSSPHPVPCIDSSYKDRSMGISRGTMGPEGRGFGVPGSYVKAIACGGRHSAVITDAGALLTFGWGLYGQVRYFNFLNFQQRDMKMPNVYRFGILLLILSFYGISVSESCNSIIQCGHGSTDDELSPTCVSSLLGIRIEGVAGGLWHTISISADGDVYAFGGNQFGQLGTGADQAETLPQLLDAPSLENVHAKVVSCGARHSAVITEDGKTFCWGWNKYGQLGLGDVIDRNTPSQVSLDGYVARNVACGWWHSLLLAESPA